MITKKKSMGSKMVWLKQSSIKGWVRIVDLNVASGRSQGMGGALNSRFGEIFKGRSCEYNSNRQD